MLVQGPHNPKPMNAIKLNQDCWTNSRKGPIPSSQFQIVSPMTFLRAPWGRSWEIFHTFRTGGRFCFAAAAHHFAPTGKSFIALNTPRPRFFLPIVVGLDEKLATFLQIKTSIWPWFRAALSSYNPKMISLASGIWHSESLLVQYLFYPSRHLVIVSCYLAPKLFH